MKYVALIRAINVGGNSVISMAELKRMVESLGHTEVTTYIQTGNVVFATPSPDRVELAKALEAKLQTRMKYEAKVFILTPDELQAASRHNPYGEPDDHQVQVMFLDTPPQPDRVEKLLAMAGNEYKFSVWERVLYYSYPKQVGIGRRTAAGNRRTINFEKVLGVVGTARNIKVVNKLIELAR